MNEHTQWTQAAKRLLDESTENLDAATLSRLNRARQAALMARSRKPSVFAFAGLASACVLLLALGLHHARRESAAARDVAVPDESVDFLIDDAGADDDDPVAEFAFFAGVDEEG
jgi:hypothetical protein